MTMGLAIWLQCTPSLPLASSKDKRPYDDDARILHPEFQVLPHGTNDSVDLFLAVKRPELLYLREEPEAPFVSRIGLTLGSQYAEWTDTLATDAQETWRLQITWPMDSASWLLPTLSGSLADVHRGTSVALSTVASLPVFYADGWPVASNQIAQNTSLAIAAIPHSDWQLQYVRISPSLPSPPFSVSRNQKDSLAFGEPQFLSASGTGLLMVEVGESSLVCSNKTPDGSYKSAIVLHGRRPDFPHTRKVTDLIECSRYITSRAEYERMTSSDDPKAALDRFWLDCADDPARAKELIRIFYDRVEEANQYFSGLQEGWRTDRGMVHIVFGVPSKVRKYNDQEWWVYGEEGTPNAITFRFNKISNGLDDNDFELDRSITYRAAWDRMVTSWRNGRIRGD